jgi:integrase
LGTHPVVLAVFPAMRREDISRQRPRALGWDLSLVLQDLSELQQPLTRLQVTYKALFLAAFSSGARLSELAAWQAPLFFTEEGATVRFDPLFVPKKTRTSRPHSALPPIHILRLPQQDALICPVVALQQYDATVESRTPGSRFWVHPTSGSAATSRHLSAWLRASIASAYRRARQAPPAHFTPHSIRAAAATWAWQSNVPMATILEQCRWASESTFTRFYLRRLQETDGLLHRFKPLAVASLL